MKIRTGCFGLLIMGILFISNVSFAQTFSIIPKGDVPRSVPKYGKTSVYYTVKNITGLAQNGNFLKSPPKNVTQVTCDPNYCGATFNLGPNGSPTDSCILKLTIKGAVFSKITVCTAGASSCNNSNVPLHIRVGMTAPFIGISVGNYDDSFTGLFPLLAVTNNTGNTWRYPSSIFNNLQANIDPSAIGGVLEGASCTGSVDKSVCIGVGQWRSRPIDEEFVFPLVAVGTNNGTSWSYPKSVFTNLPARIDPDLVGGWFKAGSCFGSGTNNSVCIASGVSFTKQLMSPLIGVSSNGGKDWSYPTSVFKNLDTSIASNLSAAFLNTASCTKNTCNPVCIASGGFSTTTDSNQPLLALSTDKGQTWIYPPSIFKNLQTIFGPNFQSANFFGASCTGNGSEAVCIAAGDFYNGESLPVLALTQNGGSNWSYPASLFTDLTLKIDSNFIGGYFSSASCAGTGSKAICVAAGAYFTPENSHTPFLALSRNGGTSWTYPHSVFKNLKKDVDPKFKRGTFEGVSCTGSGKNTICVAAGGYCRDVSCLDGAPLVAVSSNGGRSWSYPESIFKHLKSVIDPDFSHGNFNDVNCSGTIKHNFCIASGQYSTSENTYPLTAISRDSGRTWTYPPYIFRNLTTTIGPNFVNGRFLRVGTSGGN